MDARAHNKLFVPVQVGAITLKHRVVMPPLSRLRAEWPSGVWPRGVEPVKSSWMT